MRESVAGESVKSTGWRLCMAFDLSTNVRKVMLLRTNMNEFRSISSERAKNSIILFYFSFF